MRAVLVLGGAGYIGSQACKQLSRAGYLPVVLDNLSTGNRWAVKYGPIVIADIEDRDAVRRTVRQHGIRDAMHFAAKEWSSRRSPSR